MLSDGRLTKIVVYSIHKSENYVSTQNDKAYRK